MCFNVFEKDISSLFLGCKWRDLQEAFSNASVKHRQDSFGARCLLVVLSSVLRTSPIYEHGSRANRLIWKPSWTADYINVPETIQWYRLCILPKCICRKLCCDESSRRHLQQQVELYVILYARGPKLVYVDIAKLLQANTEVIWNLVFDPRTHT